MPTVQSLVFELASKIDPTIKSTGAMFTPATVGTADGDRFTSNQLLGFYNKARLTVGQVAMAEFGESWAKEQLSGLVTVGVLNVTFVTDSGYVSFALPDGYLAFVGLMNTSSPPIPIHKLKTDLEQVVKSGIDSFYTESATRMFVFESGGKMWHYSGIITNGISANLSYIGVTDWTLAQVTAGVVSETLDERFQTRLIEVAIALSQGMGTVDANALAKRLLKA